MGPTRFLKRRHLLPTVYTFKNHFYLENDGLKTTIFQSGETDLSGFGFGSNFILGGSDNNDGKYTVSSIKPNTSILEVSGILARRSRCRNN